MTTKDLVVAGFWVLALIAFGLVVFDVPKSEDVIKFIAAGLFFTVFGFEIDRIWRV